MEKLRKDLYVHMPWVYTLICALFLLVGLMACSKSGYGGTITPTVNTGCIIVTETHNLNGVYCKVEIQPVQTINPDS